MLLPVTLADGYVIRYGTWLQLTSEADFDRARELWHAPEYPSLVLNGILGNAIEPWVAAADEGTRRGAGRA